MINGQVAKTGWVMTLSYHYIPVYTNNTADV